MNLKKFKVVLSVAVVIAIVGSYFFPKVQQTVQQALGANPGTDSTSNFQVVGGVETWSYGQRLVVSTSTPCTIKSPSATSTLIYASLQLSLATSTTLVFDVAKDTISNGVVAGSNGYATTTKISRFSYTSGTTGTMNATTTGAVLASTNASKTVDDIETFPPNSFLVWKFVNGSAVVSLGGYASTWPLGTCKAVFRVN